MIIINHIILNFTDATNIQGFLDSLTLPQITAEDKVMLDAPITTEEITQAITSMQNGKTPGPDGFPVEFYKAFISKLAPFSCLLFQEITSDRKLPLTMTQATISVLLKVEIHWTVVHIVQLACCVVITRFSQKFYRIAEKQ